MRERERESDSQRERANGKPLSIDQVRLRFHTMLKIIE